MKAINLFNHWVDLGKDEGMEVNHTPSVNHMLHLIPSNILDSQFSFLDIGCGNGWVVKKMSSFKNCIRSVGVDGAEKMIKKAILKDEKSEYLVLDINEIKHYHEDFDIICNAVKDLPLLTGGSGIALGLPQIYKERGYLSGSNFKIPEIQSTYGKSWIRPEKI